MIYLAAGVPLKNPTLLAAGILGTTGASMMRIIQNGAGGVVTKSIGPIPVYGHPNPSMITLNANGGTGLTYGYLNAMGLPNPSYENSNRKLNSLKNRRKTAKKHLLLQVFSEAMQRISSLLQKA